MSNTPPVNQSAAGPAAAKNDAGDGAEASVVQARGAQRNGTVWILAASLALIVVLMLGYVAIHSRHMETINHPAGRDLNAADVNTFQAPPPSARQAPPGEPSTEPSANTAH